MARPVHFWVRFSLLEKGDPAKALVPGGENRCNRHSLETPVLSTVIRRRRARGRHVATAMATARHVLGSACPTSFQVNSGGTPRVLAEGSQRDPTTVPNDCVHR